MRSKSRLGLFRLLSPRRLNALLADRTCPLPLLGFSLIGQSSRLLLLGFHCNQIFRHLSRAMKSLSTPACRSLAASMAMSSSSVVNWPHTRGIEMCHGLAELCLQAILAHKASDLLVPYALFLLSSLARHGKRLCFRLFITRITGFSFIRSVACFSSTRPPVGPPSTRIQQRFRTAALTMTSSAGH